MQYMPLMVRLEGMRVVVIGGGHVAARRIQRLQHYVQDLHVISPTLNKALEQLHQQGKVTWDARTYRPGDVKYADLIVIATDDSTINTQIRHEAPERALINVVSESDKGNIHIPSIIQRGRLSIGISTGGASPFLASQLKQEIGKQFDDNYEHYIDFLYECRKQIKASTLDAYEKQALLKSLLSEEYLKPTSQRQMLEKLKNQL